MLSRIRYGQGVLVPRMKEQDTRVSHLLLKRVIDPY